MVFIVFAILRKTNYTLKCVVHSFDFDIVWFTLSICVFVQHSTIQFVRKKGGRAPFIKTTSKQAVNQLSNRSECAKWKFLNYVYAHSMFSRFIYCSDQESLEKQAAPQFWWQQLSTWSHSTRWAGSHFPCIKIKMWQTVCVPHVIQCSLFSFFVIKFVLHL